MDLDMTYSWLMQNSLLIPAELSLY